MLNPEQLRAVRSESRYAAVTAGPGTGKTKTLVSRILYLLQEKQVKPREITAVTFTRKAAAELRERLEKALGGKRRLRDLQIGTFHSVALEALKQAGEEVQLAEGMECLELAKETVSLFHLPLQRRKADRRDLPDQVRQGLRFNPPGGPGSLPEAAGGKGAAGFRRSAAAGRGIF